MRRLSGLGPIWKKAICHIRDANSLSSRSEHKRDCEGGRGARGSQVHKQKEGRPAPEGSGMLEKGKGEGEGEGEFLRWVVRVLVLIDKTWVVVVVGGGGGG